MLASPLAGHQCIKTGLYRRCGATINLTPFNRLLQQGVEPDKAWERARQRIADRVVYGRWYEDERVDRAPAEYGKPCSVPEIK